MVEIFGGSNLPRSKVHLEDESLYQLIRTSCDTPDDIDQEAYAACRELTDAYYDARLAQVGGEGGFVSWELTCFREEDGLRIRCKTTVQRSRGPALGKLFALPLVGRGDPLMQVPCNLLQYGIHHKKNSGLAGWHMGSWAQSVYPRSFYLEGTRALGPRPGPKDNSKGAGRAEGKDSGPQGTTRIPFTQHSGRPIRGALLDRW